MLGCSRVLAIVVAVLYFDNHTNLREYDVLRKGLADMVVTDLAGGPNVKVVERARLDELIAEMKLQRSPFFDPRTARKVGRGLGATHVVTGAITSVAPKIRLDVRLIELRSGEVQLAKKVVGKPERFFQLEAELIRSLAASLGAKVEVATGPRDLKSAMAYSEAVESADRGDYRKAAAKMGEILQMDPEFLLAREQYARYAKRLRSAKGAREAALTRIRGELTERMEATIEKYRRPRGGRGELDFALCAHAVLGNLVLSDLKAKLRAMTVEEPRPGQIALAPKRARKDVVKLHRAFYRRMSKMFAFAEAHRPALASTRETVDCFVLREDRERLDALGVPVPKRLHLSEDRIKRATAGYLIFGGPPSYTGYRFTLWPSLAQADPKLREHAFSLIDDEWVDFKAKALLLFGRTKEAIETWQRFLERNPTAKDYERIEQLMERALGLDESSRAFRAALVGCDPVLAERVGDEAERLGWAEGTRALPGLVKRVKSKCQKKRDGVVRAAYLAAAKEAVFRGDCEMYERFAEARPDLAEGHPEVAVALEDACR